MPEAEADRRLSGDRSDADAMAAKGDHRLLNGDHRGASAFYETALGLLQQRGRGGGVLAGRVAENIGWLHRRFGDHLVDSLSAAGFPRGDWHPRFARALAIMQGHARREPTPAAFPQMPLAFYYPGLPLVEYAPRDAFAWADAIEAQTDAIRAEGERLLGETGGFDAYVKRIDDRPQGDVHGMLDNRDWTSFELTRRGEFVPERTALCPVTEATLSEHAPLCRIAGRAPTPMFSLLAAGRRIPPHTGMLNTRFVCHLPLIVPGGGGLRVGATTRGWEVGRLMLFDDTVEHEAWNDADEDRLVLIFDVWRPELEQAERAQIQALFAAVDSY